MVSFGKQLQATAQAAVRHPRAQLSAWGMGLAAGSVLIAAWRLWRRTSRLQRFRQVPGALPFLGNYELLDVDRAVETVEGWARKYGEEGIFEISIAGERMVVVCNYEQSLPLLALRPFKLARSQIIKKLGLTDMIQGVFNMEGRRWSTHRRLVAPSFNAQAIESYKPGVHASIGKLLDEIDKRAVSGELANVSLLAQSFSADNISKLAFGEDFGSLSRYSAELADLDAYGKSSMKRFMSPIPYWKVPGLGSLIDGGEAAVARLRRKFRSILDRRSDLGAATLLQKLIEAEGGKLTHEEVIGNVINFFIAGTDTSSHTLSWALYHLSQQPELQSAVAAEVVGLSDGVAAAEQIKALSMTQAVWKETLRFNSVLPVLSFTNQEPIVLHGREIPTGTEIALLTREVCRTSSAMQEAVGSDLDAFRPARWLAPSGGLVNCAPFDTLAFGHGARKCIGMDLVNLYGPWVLAEVVRRFHIAEWEGPPMKEKTAIMQQPAQDVYLRFARRSP